MLLEDTRPSLAGGLVFVGKALLVQRELMRLIEEVEWAVFIVLRTT